MLLKTEIRGVPLVSAKHLQGYLSEDAWRWNHRDQPGDVPIPASSGV